MTKESNAELNAEIETALEEYRRLWPEPYELAPNLNLAAQANAALAEMQAELETAQETLMRLRSWAANAAFNGEASGDDILAILNSAASNELLPVSEKPYRERGGRIPTQEERDEVREALANKKQEIYNKLKRTSAIDLEGLATALFERSHEPAFSDDSSGMKEARKFAQDLIEAYIEPKESSEAGTPAEDPQATNAWIDFSRRGNAPLSHNEESKREELALSEAELYAPNDEEAQDDFLTGWRTADRTRATEEDNLNATNGVNS